MAERTERKPVKYPYVTGFCDSSAHEGSALLSPKGALLRACSGTYTIQGKTYHCGCDCHEAFREIAALTGLTTQNAGSGALIAPTLLENIEGPTDVPDTEDTPDTATVDTQELLPTIALSGVSSLPAVPETTLVPASATAGRVTTVQYRAPVTTAPVFQATPTGRRARGELEADVLRFLGEWFPNLQEQPITPKMISLALPGQPSQGAIYAIIKKYEGTRITVAEKPFRVVSFK